MSVANPILYCGDTDQNGAAAYLSGVMASLGLEFDYVPSHVPMSADRLDSARHLLILSDYPSALFDDGCQCKAVELIEQGCALLMIGGWESFHGFGGNWDGTPIGNALPVEIQSTDDRINFPQSAFLLPSCNHEITSNLPWHQCPPAIGGMNRVRVKPSATVLLHAHSFIVSNRSHQGQYNSGDWSFAPKETFPALAVGQAGAGRTAAFLTDVAPHWVGGFVDWGHGRVAAQARNSGAIEVGQLYALFWRQLLQWLML
jgi:uncharacterized membrane protein